ncbi:MAG: PLP-dependent aminotransferase family protein [Clostridia bacterium]|nr:PLP-dependent aminotransferase family protein [Clostridia bacterium]
MNINISDRMTKHDFQGEFTSAILKAAASPDLISFGGGLPNPISFPVKEMEDAVHKVLTENGVQALQYSGTAGYEPLRRFIAERYKKWGVDDVTAEDIIITNGSQQALDMFSAALINPGDEIALESPSYLAALQSFHLYDPVILPVELTEEGINCEELEETLKNHSPKFIYIIPNFQNPTGLTYTKATREKAAEILKKYGTLVIEDNPYGELRFRGEGGYSFGRYLGEQCCMLGTFSKVVSPGMRVGWLACKNKLLREKLTAYKMTMDLHTNIFCQMVLAQYLADNDLDQHIEKTKELYQHKADFMMECISKYLPEGVTYTKPEGGMFIWATVPEGMKAVEVQSAAIKKGVVVVAGDPFYEYERGVRTMRINYSNSTDDAIEKGIRLLGDTIRELQASK